MVELKGLPVHKLCNDVDVWKSKIARGICELKFPLDAHNCKVNSPKDMAWREWEGGGEEVGYKKMNDAVFL